MQSLSPRPSMLRFATFLSPALYEAYAYIAWYIGEKLGYATQLSTGQTEQAFTAFAERQVDIAFLCGLLYVRMAKQPDCPIELLVAPILHGERYSNKPFYFSDVIVRSSSAYSSFDDLEGCVWGYNEQTSHSGWNVVCYTLHQRRKTLDYFNYTVETGSHLESLRMVLEGKVDAAAIDSHVLDILLLSHPELAASLRIIDTLGPSAIPPIVVRKSLDATVKVRIQATLLAIQHDPFAARVLCDSLIERFVPVTDAHYQDIRHMLRMAQTMSGSADGTTQSSERYSTPRA